jgi:cobalt-zinc-cadmium efflux system outer membrane protein
MRHPVSLYVSIVGVVFASGAHANETPQSVVPAIAQQQATRAPTLDLVLQRVAQHYPPLLAAEQERQAAEADWLAAQGGFDPALRSRLTHTPIGQYPQTRVDATVEQATPWWGASWFGGYRLGAGKIAPYDGKWETNEGGEVRLGVQVPLWRNGVIDRRRLTLWRAEAGLDIAMANLAQQRLEAWRQAAVRYWEWVAATHKTHLAHKLLELAQNRERDLAEAVRRGNIPAIESIENQRAIAQRHAQWVQNQRQQTQSSIELSLFFRDEQGQPYLMTPPTTPPAWPRSPTQLNTPKQRLETAMRYRPERQRLRAQIQQADWERQFAANQVNPVVDFSLSGAQDLGTGSSQRATPELEGSLNLDIPLRNRGPEGRLAQAEAVIRRLNAQTRLADDRITADVNDASNAVEKAQERLKWVENERAIAQDLESRERERFKLGDGTMFMVNLREQTTFEARMREIDAQLDHARALAALQAATGWPESTPMP